MTRTAIVPEEPSIEMDRAGDEKRKLAYLDHDAIYTAMLNARPAVPDELIEEAATEIFLLARIPRYWFELSDSEQETFRNMARAAARVFNGGKDE